MSSANDQICDKLRGLRLEYLAHASMLDYSTKNMNRSLGEKLIKLSDTKNIRPIEYFCCLKCGLPRALTEGRDCDCK